MYTRIIRICALLWGSVLLISCGVAPITPGTSASPSPSAASPPGTSTPTPATPTLETPGASAEPSALQYLWPEPLPGGMLIDRASSWADATGFNLALTDPAELQNQIWIVSSSKQGREPNPGSRPVTVRGVEGWAFTTGAGWSVSWVEHDQPVSIGGFLLSPERAVALAETLRPIDVATWKQRLADAEAAPSATAVVEQCPAIDTKGDVSVANDPFCVVWNDHFASERGFRIDLQYGGGEMFSYQASADETQFVMPPEDAPRIDESRDLCQRRGSFSLTVTALLPEGEQLIGGMGMDSECMMGYAETPTPEADEVYAVYGVLEVDPNAATPQPVVSSLRRLNLQSGDERVLASVEDCAITGVALSPDGSMIAYAVGECPTPELRLIGIDGASQRVLLSESVQIGRDAFSPDGTRLAIVRQRDAGDAPVPQGAIATVMLSDGAATDVGEWGFFRSAPAWIDADRLAFSIAAIGTPPAQWTTYVIDARPGAQPDTLGAGLLADVSPDRSTLALLIEQADDALKIGLLPSTGGDARIVETPLHGAQIAFSPDGTQLAYTNAGIFDGQPTTLVETVDVATLQTATLLKETAADGGVAALAWTRAGVCVARSGLSSADVGLIFPSDDVVYGPTAIVRGMLGPLTTTH